MVKVTFRTSIEFDDDTWQEFLSKSPMPVALLHSTMKSLFAEGFKLKYGFQPSAIGVFPIDPQTKVEPEILVD